MRSREKHVGVEGAVGEGKRLVRVELNHLKFTNLSVILLKVRFCACDTQAHVCLLLAHKSAKSREKGAPSHAKSSDCVHA